MMNERTLTYLCSFLLVFQIYSRNMDRDTKQEVITTKDEDMRTVLWWRLVSRAGGWVHLWP